MSAGIADCIKGSVDIEHRNLLPADRHCLLQPGATSFLSRILTSSPISSPLGCVLQDSRFVVCRSVPSIDLSPPYFPGVAEFQRSPTVVSVGLLAPPNNHAFELTETVSRRDFAVAMARPRRLVSLSRNEAPVIPTSRLVPSNVLYRDVQLVLQSGLRTLDTPENSMFNEGLMGKQAVNTVRNFLLFFP
jgi:hypothetical protein